MRVQAVDLLVNGLRPSLASARNPDVAGYLHDGSPARGPTERAEEPAGRRARRRPAEAPDRPCPTAVVSLDGRPAAGARSTAAASWPAPRGRDPLGTAAPAPGSARSDPDRARRCARTNRPRRIRQNLSFANRPSWRGRGRSWRCSSRVVPFCRSPRSTQRHTAGGGGRPPHLVHGRGGRGLAGGAAHDPRRAALVIAPGDPDRADAAGPLPPRPAPDRGPDRLDPPPARARPGRARPHHPVPPGRDAGGAAVTLGRRAAAPAGGQHGAEAGRARRVAGREAW